MKKLNEELAKAVRIGLTTRLGGLKDSIFQNQSFVIAVSWKSLVKLLDLLP